MVDDFQPSRQKTDLAEVVEMLLDKGIVINADIAVSIGDTQLLGIQVRAAIASFETAAKYGLEFPEGTDMRRVAEAVGDPELAEMDRPNPAIDPTRGVNVTPDPEDDDDGEKSDEEAAQADESEAEAESGETDGGRPEGEIDDSSGDESYEAPSGVSERVGTRPDPNRPTSGGFNMLSNNDGDDTEHDDEAGDEETEATTEADTQ
ncbi:gas vesicle protein GvpJ [Halostagnicola bangensis]